jgi:mono/diheme cytochrome c family protein
MSSHNGWFTKKRVFGGGVVVALMLGAALIFTNGFFGGATVTGQDSKKVTIPSTSNAETLALGKKLYGTQCASCHGANLKGEKNWRSRNSDGTLKAPPHDKSGHTWHHSDDLLFRYTKFGGAIIGGGTFKSAMPGFGDKLSDAQIITILTYIKSRWPEAVQERQAQITKLRQ